MTLFSVIASCLELEHILFLSQGMRHQSPIAFCTQVAAPFSLTWASARLSLAHGFTPRLRYLSPQMTNCSAASGRPACGSEITTRLPDTNTTPSRHAQNAHAYTLVFNKSKSGEKAEGWGWRVVLLSRFSLQVSTEGPFHQRCFLQVRNSFKFLNLWQHPLRWFFWKSKAVSQKRKGFMFWTLL